VLLEGTVDSRWAKRIAEEIVETVSGVEDVQNNLRVGRGMPTRESSTVDAGDQLHKSLDNRARAKGA
jgi:hypothetical protein